MVEIPDAPVRVARDTTSGVSATSATDGDKTKTSTSTRFGGDEYDGGYGSHHHHHHHGGGGGFGE